MVRVVALSALLCLAVLGLVARGSTADAPPSQFAASYEGAPFAGWITANGPAGAPFQIKAQGSGGDWILLHTGVIPPNRAVTVAVQHPFPGGETALYSVSFGPMGAPWAVIIIDGFDGFLWD